MEKDLIRTILFDLDGTLVDSYPPITESLNAVRKAFGQEPKSEPEVRREVGRGLEQLIAENVGEPNVAEGVRIFRARYREVFLSGTRLLPGVEATIATLSGRGYRMGVASNKPAYFTREILLALGLNGAIGAVWGPERVRRPKPDPEMLFGALGELGGSLPGSVYVGDMTLDVEVARRAGLPVWVVPSGGHGREELERAGPDRLLERFEELADLLPPLPAVSR